MLRFGLGPRYSIEAVTEQEYSIFEDFIRSHLTHFDVEHVRKEYAAGTSKLLVDPFSPDIIVSIRRALTDRTPYSVVRIGDGEANFASFGAYPGTPNLDRYAFAQSIANQQDKFRATETWMLVLCDLMRHAILDADVVGVLGLWRPEPAGNEKIAASTRIENFRRDPRGRTGHLRGVDLMLRWAREGRFATQCVATAHLYFSILLQLEELLPHAGKVICLTDKAIAMAALRRKFPNGRFELIPVGKSNGMIRRAATEPDFLWRIATQIPRDMSGHLCLIGAGVWAEYYCMLVKQRGGVAIDFGSGFDLLAGEGTRPVHKLIPESAISGVRSFRSAN